MAAIKKIIKLCSQLDKLGLRIAEESRLGDKFAKKDLIEMAQEYQHILSSTEYSLKGLYNVYCFYLREKPKDL